MSFLRNRFTRNVALAGALAASAFGLEGLVARSASADVIDPVAAHLNGAQGSVWRSDAKVYNPTGQPVTVTIYATPRGQTASPADPTLTRTVGAGMTLVLEDVEYVIRGEGSWADRLRFTFKDGSGNPVANLPVKATTYEQPAPRSEFGAFVTLFDPAANPAQYPLDGYSLPGTVLGTILGKASERDGVIISVGPQGATLAWTYNNGAGANTFSKTVAYGPDQTFQYSGSVPELLGFQPEANGSLTAKVLAGSARVALTHNNNTTNSPNWDQMTPMPGSMSADDVAINYVAKWLPREDSGFYMNNREIRCMINGNCSTRSYTHDLATILFAHTTPQIPNTEAFLEQALLEEAKPLLTPGHLYHGFDPIQWSAPANGMRLYEEPDGRSATDFGMDADGMTQTYDLIKDFLWHFVRSNPDEYGGQLGGLPDMNHNPTWNTQDPN